VLPHLPPLLLPQLTFQDGEEKRKTGGAARPSDQLRLELYSLGIVPVLVAIMESTEADTPDGMALLERAVQVREQGQRCPWVYVVPIFLPSHLPSSPRAQLLLSQTAPHLPPAFGPAAPSAGHLQHRLQPLGADQLGPGTGLDRRLRRAAGAAAPHAQERCLCRGG
jgi:hypothetical protein